MLDMNGNSWFKIYGTRLINLPYIGVSLERFFTPLFIVLKWLIPKRGFALSTEALELARRSKKNAGTKNENSKEIVLVNRNLMQGQIGGVNFLVLILAFGLQERGHNVTILCESPNPWKISKTINGISIIGIRPKLFFIRHTSPSLYAGWSQSVENFLDNSPGQGKVINVFATIAGLETFRTRKLPVHIKSFCYLVTDHIIHKVGVNQDYKKSLRISRFLSAEHMFLTSRDTHVIGDSKAIVKDISRVLELPDLVANTEIIHIGWPTNDHLEEFDLPNGKLVTYIGAVSFRKGTRTLIDAWKLICNHPQYSDCFLVICGPTSDDPESEAIIKNSKVSDRIVRIKSMSEGQKSFILSKSSVVVIPSKYESFGIVALEAMQQGCQIIASRVGGLPEVLGDCAEFFTPGSSEELAQKIQSVISGLLHIPIDKIIERANIFSFETMLARFEDIFE